jgi:hypothetical protein
MERDPHERCLHDRPIGERTIEVVGREAGDARPQRDVRRRRLLRLEAGERLDRRDDRQRCRLDQVLPGERRPVQLRRRDDGNIRSVAAATGGQGTTDGGGDPAPPGARLGASGSALAPATGPPSELAPGSAAATAIERPARKSPISAV